MGVFDNHPLQQSPSGAFRTTSAPFTLPAGSTLAIASSFLGSLANTVLGAAQVIGPECEFPVAPLKGLTDGLEVAVNLNFAFESVGSQDRLLLTVEGELNNSGVWIAIPELSGNEGGPDNSAPTQKSLGVQAYCPAASLPVGLQAAGQLRLRTLVAGAGTFRISQDADEAGGLSVVAKYIKD